MAKEICFSILMNSWSKSVRTGGENWFNEIYSIHSKSRKKEKSGKIPFCPKLHSVTKYRMHFWEGSTNPKGGNHTRSWQAISLKREGQSKEASSSLHLSPVKITFHPSSFGEKIHLYSSRPGSGHPAYLELKKELMFWYRICTCHLGTDRSTSRFTLLIQV